MEVTLLIVLGATVLLAAVLTYGMTRRYGWAAALAMPVLAVVLILAMQLQRAWSEGEGVLQTLWLVLPLLAPILLGSAAGIVVARLRRHQR